MTSNQIRVMDNKELGGMIAQRIHVVELNAEVEEYVRDLHLLYEERAKRQKRGGR